MMSTSVAGPGDVSPDGGEPLSQSVVVGSVQSPPASSVPMDQASSPVPVFSMNNGKVAVCPVWTLKLNSSGLISEIGSNRVWNPNTSLQAPSPQALLARTRQ